MKLSVIVPGIRPQNWVKLYESLYTAFFHFGNDAEIIFIGPYQPPSIIDVLNTTKNIKYIHSLRSPSACQQIGLYVSQGDYITWAADDGTFIPYTLDEALRHIMLLEANSNLDKEIDCHKNIVVGRYLEGDNPIGMKSEDYYRFKYHKPYRLAGINPEWLIFNCGLISRKFLLELGGWDAENFEVPTIAHADLGIRAQKAGAKMVLMKEPMFKCSHQPGKSGDHAPIHVAQTKRDLPKFQQMYSRPNDRINIELNNWQYTEEVWKERFK